MKKVKISPEELANKIAEYEASGENLHKWCIDKNLHYDQLRYHVNKKNRDKETPKKLSPTKVTPTQWVKLKVDTEAPIKEVKSLTIHIRQTKIEITSGFDPILLSDVVKALEN